MIAVIDYNSGNIKSVMNALNRLGASATLTNDVKVIKSADRVIFPGVGAAAAAMENLRKEI